MQPLALALLLPVALGLAKLSVAIGFENGVSPIWLNTSLYLFLFLRLGFGYAPYLLIVEFVSLYVTSYAGMPLSQGVPMAAFADVIDVGEAMLDAYVIGRWLGLGQTGTFILVRPHHVFAFLALLVVPGGALSGVLGALSLCALGISPCDAFWSTGYYWMVGSVTASILVVPLLDEMGRQGGEGTRLARRLEALARQMDVDAMAELLQSVAQA